MQASRGAHFLHLACQGGARTPAPQSASPLTIGKPHCFDHVWKKAEVGKVPEAVSLICTEVFLRFTHQKLD